MKKYIIISLFAAACFNSNAQDLLNTENNFYTKENFSGSFNLGIDYNSGNVDTNNLDFAGNINYKYTDNIIRLYGQKKYGKTNNTKSVDNETFSIRYVKENALYDNDIESYIQYQNNFFTNLKSRKSIALGTRSISSLIGVYEHDLRYNYYLGLSNEKEIGSNEEKRTALRLDIFFESQLLLNREENKILFFKLQYQPKIDEMKNYRIYTTIGIEFILIGNVIFGSNYSVEYNSYSFNLINNSDKSFKTYLRYKF